VWASAAVAALFFLFEVTGGAGPYQDREPQFKIACHADASVGNFAFPFNEDGISRYGPTRVIERVDQQSQVYMGMAREFDLRVSAPRLFHSNGNRVGHRNETTREFKLSSVRHPHAALSSPSALGWAAR
jgi:hypothetical protein